MDGQVEQRGRESMNKRERVIATLEGKKTDGTASSFSLHFSQDKVHGEAGIKAHLDFFSDTDVDIMKIMNENLIPALPGINSARDWKRIPSYSRDAEFIQKETDLVKAILDRTPEPAVSLVTIHGICASMVHPCRPQYSALSDIRAMQLQHFREDPRTFLDAAQRIADAQCLMVEETLATGADGIYYASLGGERDIYTDEEFEQAIKPFDLQIMKACKDMGRYVVLHMCKSNLAMERFRSYAPYCDVVNWGIYCNNFSLEQGAALFPGKTLMGGLENRSGVIVDGTPEELEAEVHRVIASMKNEKFILGADCTLGTTISHERVHTAVMAARSARD